MGAGRVRARRGSGSIRVRQPKACRRLRPTTVNRMRETLRSALPTAVRQDRLIRNVDRYGGGAAVRPPVDRFTDHELALILKAARDEHFFPIILLLARTGKVCGSGRRASCADAT